MLLNITENSTPDFQQETYQFLLTNIVPLELVRRALSHFPLQ